MMSERAYDMIRKKVSKIAGGFVSANVKSAERPITENLLDIERQLDRYITYYSIVLRAEMRAKNIDADSSSKPDAVTKAKIKSLNCKQLSSKIRENHIKES